ncbi:peptide-methionine (S)-S-oxide reductase MsrA [Clostridium senegalense]|uniref:peptide-methionine (S)-S-oxide reductase MsrA n=1 Tax=Clostridium senegalense TaxID=1465809 RepID=UPI001C115E83|nr:peptide-methionine (S)-S-oxide reductase MsrA [Clostridium senegalense]MBU5226975.1 peptide-methionine (S)-S-oxide reductase MsrA [Clostridium senegalense]
MCTKNYEKAIFAGGCFWCMVSPFDILDGIIKVTSGYIGGTLDNPTYKDVKSQSSGHYEAIEVIFDPKVISYKDLVDVFWRQIDPTDDEGQFQDRGNSYRAAIFYLTEGQKLIAEESKENLNNSKRFEKPVITRILPATTFYNAEEYHQNFYKKNSKEYKKDREKSGRDEFINKYWGDEYYNIYETLPLKEE